MAFAPPVAALSPDVAQFRRQCFAAHGEKAPAEPREIGAPGPFEHREQAGHVLQHGNAADRQADIDAVGQRDADGNAARDPRAVDDGAAHDEEEVRARTQQGEEMRPRDHQKLLPQRHTVLHP